MNEELLLLELKEIVKGKDEAAKNQNWSLAADFKRRENEILNKIPIVVKLKQIGITTIT